MPLGTVPSVPSPKSGTGRAKTNVEKTRMMKEEHCELRTVERSQHESEIDVCRP